VRFILNKWTKQHLKLFRFERSLSWPSVAENALGGIVCLTIGASFIGGGSDISPAPEGQETQPLESTSIPAVLHEKDMPASPSLISDTAPYFDFLYNKTDQDRTIGVAFEQGTTGKFSDTYTKIYLIDFHSTSTQNGEPALQAWLELKDFEFVQGVRGQNGRALLVRQNEPFIIATERAKYQLTLTGPGNVNNGRFLNFEVVDL
jgi:hypothetical protein